MKRHLARIKQIFLHALKSAGKNDEINLILLVQLLDFAVESFLKLVIHHFPQPGSYPGPQSDYSNKIAQLQDQKYSPRLDFYRAWDEVTGILKDTQNGIGINSLPNRRDLTQLHDLRNDVQHKLKTPHPLDANKYIPIVESFFINTYQDIFGEDFESISYLELVDNTDIKARLQSAYTHLNAGRWDDTVNESAICLYMLKELSKIMASFNPFFSPFSVGNKITSALEPLFPDANFSQLNNIRREFESIINEINLLQELIVVMGSGVNLVRYVQYKRSMPYVYQTIDYSYHVNLEKRYTEDEARDILKFVEAQVLAAQSSGVS